MRLRANHVLIGVAVVVVLTSLGHAVEQKPLPARCPEPGSVVPLVKAMNSSFIDDFKNCDIVVEAAFWQMGTPQGFKLGGYDSKKNTTFQVLEPGGAPQAGPFGQSFGTFAGTPKDQADVLLQAKKGDVLLLRGAPIKLKTFFGMASIGAAIFHATEVSRKPESSH